VSTPLRLAAFAAGLGVVFAAAAGVGNAVGPVGGLPETETHSAVAAPAADPVEGLAVSEDGYTLSPESATHPTGTRAPFAFTVTGPDGQPVTAFTPTHDQDLHLIVVRRDTTGYQHVHPTRDAAGRWSIPLTLPSPGAYKVFADFAPDDRTDAITLAADVTSPGSYEPQPLPTVSRTAQVDGYTVALDGDLVAGREARLTLRVSRGGRPVTDLEPYLSAYGHLVALRVGDLAYLHVHPGGEPADGRTARGPEIGFVAEVPSDGTYRLFLDFKHEGVVRTAAFTATAGPSQASTPGGEPPPHSDHAEGH
jgi:hypothetical protein